MKAIITAAVLAAASLGGLTAVTAHAEPDGRFWHGPAEGPRWRAWRHHYRARWGREPIRVCRHRRCWYR